MNSVLLRVLRCSAFAVMGLGLTACNDEPQQPQTGALPSIVSTPYKPPNQAAAKFAYLDGFSRRYDIPVLDYPPDIKARVKAARVEKLKGSKKLLKLNMLVVKKTLTSDYIANLRGHEKTVAQQLLEHMNQTDLDDALDLVRKTDLMLDLAASISTHEKKHGSSKPVFTSADYDAAVKSYKPRIKSFTIEKCQWKEMKHLIGSGYEEMAKIHGERPASGFDCILEVHIQANPRSVRAYDGKGFFIKSASGNWQYYGKYNGVGAAPRRLSLNPKILENPERAVKTLPFWDLDI